MNSQTICPESIVTWSDTTTAILLMVAVILLFVSNTLWACRWRWARKTGNVRTKNQTEPKISIILNKSKRADVRHPTYSQITGLESPKLADLATDDLMKHGHQYLTLTKIVIEELHNKASEHEHVLELDWMLGSVFEHLEQVLANYRGICNKMTRTGHFNFERDNSTNIIAIDDTVRGHDSACLMDLEPNVHSFNIYQAALGRVKRVIKPRVDRTIATGCQSYDEFVAKYHCLREAFQLLMAKKETRDYFIAVGERMLLVQMNGNKNQNKCLKSYHKLVNYDLRRPSKAAAIKELNEHGVDCFSFVDIVLDYMLLDACDTIQSSLLHPAASPTTTTTTTTFHQELTSYQASVRFLSCKRSSLKCAHGLLAHYLDVLELVMHQAAMINFKPAVAGHNLAVIEMFKATFRDYFQRVRYTNYADLGADIIGVTKEKVADMQTSRR